MMKSASAAASTMVALIASGVAEGFSISSPNPTTRISSSRSSSRSSPDGDAATTASIARKDTSRMPSLLAVRSSTLGSRQKSRAVKLRLQSEGGGGAAANATAAGSGGQRQPGGAAAAAGIRRRPPQRQQRKTTSSVEGAIQKKHLDEVEELKENLQRFASLRMWRQAIAAFEKAKKDGLPLTSSTYTQVINVMSKGGRCVCGGLKAIALAIGRGQRPRRLPTDDPSSLPISPSVVSYNAAITACSRANKTQVALRLLGDMSAKSGLSPDLYSYAAVLSGLARARNPSQAVALLGEMREAGVEPDLVCLAATMEACKSKGAVEEAAVVLEQVRELDPPPSTAKLMGILTTAISACVIEGAGGEQSQPTLECYNAVVLGCATSGDLREALRTLKEDIPRAGLKPDTHGFNHALRGLARAEDWEGALALLNEQRSGEFPDAPPDRNSYNAAIDACGRAGQVRPATDGLRGDQRCSLAAFSAVAASAEAGREDAAAEILEEMARVGVSTSEGAVASAKEALLEML
ncbi:unnamed protein product, partial [Scytosiphon promiscuus]